MSGLTDFVKYSLSTSKGRLKDLGKDVIKGGDIRKGNPLKKAASLGGVVNPERDKEFFEQDMDRLFVGEQPKPTGPEEAAPTLKSVEYRQQEEKRKRRVASLLTTETLSKKSVLGD